MRCTYGTCQQPTELLSASFRVNCFSLSWACDMRVTLCPQPYSHTHSLCPLSQLQSSGILTNSFHHAWVCVLTRRHYSSDRRGTNAFCLTLCLLQWFIPIFTSSLAWNEVWSQVLLSLWLILYTGQKQCRSPHVSSLAQGVIFGYLTRVA